MESNQQPPPSAAFAAILDVFSAVRLKDDLACGDYLLNLFPDILTMGFSLQRNFPVRAKRKTACWFCKRPGHFARSCRFKKRAQRDVLSRSISMKSSSGLKEVGLCNVSSLQCASEAEYNSMTVLERTEFENASPVTDNHNVLETSSKDDQCSFNSFVFLPSSKSFLPKVFMKNTDIDIKEEPPDAAEEGLGYDLF